MGEFNTRYLQFSKPFIDALKEVYSTMIKVKLNHSQPVLSNNSITLGDYTGLMGMNGVFEKDGKKFQGSFMVSWPKECFLKTAGSMLSEEYIEIDE